MDKRTESQKKAQDKYVKVSTRTYAFRYNREKDSDVIEMLDRVGNKQAYVRDLIRADIAGHDGNIKEAAAEIKNERTVEISYDKSKEKWQALCPKAGLNLKSDSYDILLDKIGRSMSTDYTIKTEDIVHQKSEI